MSSKYQPGNIVGPYTLIEKIDQEKWLCRCNKCDRFDEDVESRMNEIVREYDGLMGGEPKDKGA